MRRASPFTVMLNAYWASRRRRQTQEEGDEEKTKTIWGLLMRGLALVLVEKGAERGTYRSGEWRAKRDDGQSARRRDADDVATPDFWSTWTTPRERGGPSVIGSVCRPLETNLFDKSATYSSLLIHFIRT